MERTSALAKIYMHMSDYPDPDDIGEERIVMLPMELGEQDQDQEKERDPVVERIRDGFFHFKTQHFNKYPDYYQGLVEEETPEFLVFACSDSRVSPSFLLNFKPGEAIEARNIPYIIPAFNQFGNLGVGAMIEYAVNNLLVKNILVIGHSRCGGIKALMSLSSDGTTSNDSIDHPMNIGLPAKAKVDPEWLKIGLPAKAKVESEWPDATFEEKCTYCETESVNLSLVNLFTYPSVRIAMAGNDLKVIGGYYDFVKGNFNLWKADFEAKPTIFM